MFWNCRARFGLRVVPELLRLTEVGDVSHIADGRVHLAVVNKRVHRVLHELLLDAQHLLQRAHLHLVVSRRPC